MCSWVVYDVLGYVQYSTMHGYLITYLNTFY